MLPVRMMMHFVNGAVIFPAIYAYALYDRVPGSPAIKGTAWGVALWLVAQTVVMPMMGAGLFSSAMGGMMAAMGSLIGHVLYGSLLGIIASARATGRARVNRNRQVASGCRREQRNTPRRRWSQQVLVGVYRRPGESA
jgi:hypothetical protein